MKNLHLLVSAVVIIVVGLIYGFNPSKILPYFFNFKVENLELKNIFRAIMGLYLGFAFFWLYAIKKPMYCRLATITLIIFMGGLVFGRIISTVVDGVSIQYTQGLITEMVLMLWGVYNLKKDVFLKKIKISCKIKNK